MIEARTRLLNEIEAFLKRTNMFASEFGRRVANNTALVTRLRNGLDVRLETADRIRRFMESYEPVDKQANTKIPRRQKARA
jgi:predicted transcriptional regulator